MRTLTDSQHAAVLAVAKVVPHQRRAVFLREIVNCFSGRTPTNEEVARAVDAALGAAPTEGTNQ